MLCRNPFPVLHLNAPIAGTARDENTSANQLQSTSSNKFPVKPHAEKNKRRESARLRPPNPLTPSAFQRSRFCPEGFEETLNSQMGERWSYNPSSFSYKLNSYLHISNVSCDSLAVLVRRMYIPGPLSETQYSGFAETLCSAAPLLPFSIMWRGLQHHVHADFFQNTARISVLWKSVSMVTLSRKPTKSFVSTGEHYYLL